MKPFLSIFLAMVGLTTYGAELPSGIPSSNSYPSTMYIKGSWGGGSWTWQSMTTLQDGVYSYRTTWSGNSGFNTSSSSDGKNALWFPKADIKGYDKTVITDGTEVTLIHSAASGTMSVGKSGSGMVVMLLSSAAPSMGDNVTVDLYSKVIIAVR